MTTSIVEIQVPDAVSSDVTDEALTVTLSDGRTLIAPTAWFPRLLHGSGRERENWQLMGQGEGVHREDLDEDISVEHLLAGIPSLESQKLLKKWLGARSGARTHRARRSSRQH
jgi:hypothetical protein